MMVLRLPPVWCQGRHAGFKLQQVLVCRGSRLLLTHPPLRYSPTTCTPPLCVTCSHAAHAVDCQVVELLTYSLNNSKVQRAVQRAVQLQEQGSGTPGLWACLPAGWGAGPRYCLTSKA